MLQRRKVASDLRHALGIDVADDDARPFVAFGDDHTPGVDEHAVPVRTPMVLVQATLRRGQHIALILDGARLEQNMPVRGPRHRGERRGDHDEGEVAKAAIELGKPQVVAH